MNVHLDEKLLEHYDKVQDRIKRRLQEFKEVPKSEYFYEFCFCLCTPQSKAANALIVQKKLKELDFENKPFNPVDILATPENYIRFHNQKAKRIENAPKIFPEIMSILESEESNFDKRAKIHKLVNGFGLKEASHFMRNIGYEGLAILDRHILKNLVKLGVYPEVPNISTVKGYYAAETGFLAFAREVLIPIDELDLLFWSYENGDIIK